MKSSIWRLPGRRPNRLPADPAAETHQYNLAN